MTERSFRADEDLALQGDAKKCACLPSTTYDGFRGTVNEWEAGQYILEALQAEGGSSCEDELVTVEWDVSAAYNHGLRGNN